MARPFFLSSNNGQVYEDDDGISAPSSQSYAIPIRATSYSIKPQKQQQQQPEQQNYQFTSVSEIRNLEVMASVGGGPMRFGPVCRGETIQEQILHCSPKEVESFIKLKLECEDDSKLAQAGLTDEQIIRVAAYKDFHVNKAVHLLKRMDPQYMMATVGQLEEQLRTQTLFPLPRLCSKNIDSFFYMRPCRFNPYDTPTSTIIANLVYVMDTLYERHRDYNRKIGFIANMNDWTMAHFSVDYCFQFMQTLQGRMAPLNVDLFLIVNPPVWFDCVWKIMKPMLLPAFRKKVRMIPESSLNNYLQPGFEKYLPAELGGGSASVSELVEDFISFRKHVEETCPDRAGMALDRLKPTWTPNRPERQEPPRRRPLFRRKSIQDVDSSVGTPGLISKSAHGDDNKPRQRPRLPARSRSSDDMPTAFVSARLLSWSNMDEPWGSSESVAGGEGSGSDANFPLRLLE